MCQKASRAQGRREKVPKITLEGLRGLKNETWGSPPGSEGFPRGCDYRATNDRLAVDAPR